jgi:hypothetical protein
MSPAPQDDQTMQEESNSLPASGDESSSKRKSKKMQFMQKQIAKMRREMNKASNG